MKMICRSVLCACALFASLSTFAQSWPSKPIRVVTEFIGGAGGDIAVRVIMAELSARLGQPIVIENHAGGSGVIAAQLVIHSPPDGYTLLAITPNAPVTRVHLAKGNQIDAQHTLTPVSTLFETSMVLVANPSVPANSLQELIAYAKQNPGKLSYGSNGLGSSPHLATEQLRMLTGAQFVHVPYKSLQQPMLDVATGQIPLAYALAGQAAPLVQAGKLKVIANLNEGHFPAWPSVGTFRESVPGYQPVPSWTGLWAPAGLPAPILQRLSGELKQALASPDVNAKLAKGGTVPVWNSPQDFATMIRDQTDLVGKIVKAAGIPVSD